MVKQLAAKLIFSLMKLALLISSVLYLLSACEGPQESAADLKVLTRNAPTTLYEGRDGPAGPEYDLIMSFANYHQRTVEFVVKSSIQEILEAVNNGEADIAAAGLTRTEERESRGIKFGPDYFEVQQQVVCRRNHFGVPKGPQGLSGRSIAASSYEESLRDMQ